MGDEIGKVCQSQVMKGLTCYVATPGDSRVSLMWRRCLGLSKGSMRSSSWNPDPRESPAER